MRLPSMWVRRLPMLTAFWAGTCLGGVVALAPLPASPPRPTVERASPVETFYVDASTGDDGADGRSTSRAFRTLARGVQAMRPGDTLVVGPGRYYHNPLVVRDLPGTADNPTTIRAEPRGGATISAAWSEAAEGRVTWTPVGDGVFRAEQARDRPATCGGYEGEFLLRFRNLEHLRTGDIGHKDTKAGVPPLVAPAYGFAVVDGRYYVRLPGGADPNGRRIVFAVRASETVKHWEWDGRDLKGGEPVMQVVNSPGLVLDGFRIEGAATGVRFDATSTHAIVRNCLFEYCTTGVALRSDSVVEWCEYSFPGLSRLHRHMTERNPLRKEDNLIFPLLKDYGGGIEGGIATSDTQVGFYSAARCQIRYSYMHDAFDGDNLGAFTDSESHHNVYVNCFDNAVEFENSFRNQPSRNLRFHQNLVVGYFHGAISHQEHLPTMEGPHWVYRNVIVCDRDATWNPWLVVKTSLPSGTKGINYHNNLIWLRGGKGGLYWFEGNHPPQEEALSGMRWTNNIVIFDSKLIQQPTPDPFFADANLLVAPNPRKSLLGVNGKAIASLDALGLTDPRGMDFSLTSDSPAIGAGIAVPGITPEGEARPDAGPFSFGAGGGAEWPRARRTVFAP